MNLPPRFTAISQAESKENQAAGFIGIVTDVSPVTQTRWGDAYVTFWLQDEFDINGSRMMFKIFKRNKNYLPEVGSVGDVIAIRNITVKRFNLRLEGISATKDTTETITFPAKGIPIPELKDAIAGGAQTLAYSATPPYVKPTMQEQMYAIQLRHTATRASMFLPGAKAVTEQAMGGRAVPTGPASMKSHKLALIKDMQLFSFYDIRAEVVKVFFERGDVDIYITDYTENPLLFNYEEPGASCHENDSSTQWQGPYGQMTLAVRLYGASGEWARRNVREGDFVFVKNIRTKLSKVNKMEGQVHEDRANPQQVDIRRLLQSDIAELKRRKRAYDNQMNRHDKTIYRANEPPETAAKGKQGKRGKRQEKKKKLKEERDLARAVENRVLEQKFEEEMALPAGNNPHSNLANIISNNRRQNRTPGGAETVLPFVCAKYRARVRVVDFKPDNLEDFAQSLANPSYNDLPTDSSYEDWDSTPKKWEWAFALLLEDAQPTRDPGTPPSRMRVVVSNDAAEYLLKMDATDLRVDKRALEDLREKLFFLWGNLEELKCINLLLPLPPYSQRLSNRPFDCCIEEYGYIDPQIYGEETNCQRIYRMCGTTIME
ncbi:hypothetical protein GQ43DRAFT_361865 [Delitschia confertaspora ATCC 74209]|uniref:Protection of telomeres protein 1 n=1 Tax=Delitschia confertaspora ATCC 74209 TaxID=1513339 RepID=A0A9P4MX08_9PLEO|nr:hypothetical protein GQ43DRAFT_361865 [Delitschia confertaspora ATCC 74209]